MSGDEGPGERGLDHDYWNGYDDGYEGFSVTSNPSESYLRGYRDGQEDYDMDTEDLEDAGY